MHFTFVTLFPQIIKGYFSDSILGKAVEQQKISLSYVNPRDYTTNKHLKVDEPMIGGGAGMLMTPQPLDDALLAVKKASPEAYVIFLTPVGKPFRQTDAKRLAGEKHIVLVSGRYEGLDERIVELHADAVFSVGDFILTGGELPSMMLCDAISRNVEGVLGNSESLAVESFEALLLEAPSFTKPKVYRELPVVSEFLKGNHSKIADLKNRMALFKTKYFRPDIYAKAKAKHEK